MYSLTKAQNFMHQAKRELLRVEEIRKLLYYTSPNALSLPDISEEDVEEFITLTPIIEDENGIAESYRNVFIAIYMHDLIPSDTENDLSFKIAVYSNKQNYELENEQIRVIMLMKEVIKYISNTKFQFSGKIYPINVVAENLIIGNFSGFVSTWNVVDSNEIL